MRRREGREGATYKGKGRGGNLLLTKEGQEGRRECDGKAQRGNSPQKSR